MFKITATQDSISWREDADGRIVGAPKVARDITELVRQEEALQAANAALERANGDLQQFADSASHDLQEPLRMVAAYSQLLQQRFGAQLGPIGDKYWATRLKVQCAWKAFWGRCEHTHNYLFRATAQRRCRCRSRLGKNAGFWNL
jgi:light-regulated signal transduction histidine kinase (bacteriophytochrome)